MDDVPTYSIVTVTWNGGDEVLKFLNSIYEQTFDDFEVVIADNDSEDETVALIREHYGEAPELTLLENECNLGFSAGINRAIEQTEGDYICCYNQDTRFPPDYLEMLDKWVTQDAAWTTARVNHRVSKESQCIRFRSKYGYSIPYVAESHAGIVRTNFIPGDGAIIPRRIYLGALNKVVFDEDLPTRAEDVDLGLRLRKNNIPIFAILETASIHPDKADLYEIRLDTARQFLRNTYSNFKAYSKSGTMLESIWAIVGAPMYLLDVFCHDFPRPEAAIPSIMYTQEGSVKMT